MTRPFTLAALGVALVLSTPVTFAAQIGEPIGAQRPVQVQVRDQTPPLEADRQVEPVDFFRYSGRTVLRIWQDYRLRQGDAVRDVVTVFGSATIEGQVNGDVVVVLGNVTLSSTAVVNGVVVVVAGEATVADGARVNRDMVVVGGGLNAPATFAPGGEYILVGTPWMGDQLRSIVPWLTHGLLWGRLIVPSVPWVWTVLAIVFLVSLVINQLMHRPVGLCADALAARPFSAFLAGLLVLLLAGPLSILLAVTVIGVIVLPFLWAALVLAWLVGKVGVARWLGRAVTGSDAAESPLTGLRSFVIGFVIISLLYMVPLLGLLTWAIVGTLGVGVATQTFLAAIRRERPAPLPTPPTSPPVGTPGAPPIAGAPGLAYSAADLPLVTPPVVTSEATSMPPLPSLTMPMPATGTSERAHAAQSLVGLPRAPFVDRLAALVIDALLVLLVRRMLIFNENGWFFVLLLAYFVVFWAIKGTTIGGLVCNLRVVRADGAPLEFTDALVRGLGGILSAVPFGLGFLWILRDPERQAWHDRIAGTYVVRVPR